MKETYYFPHDYNARNDEKLIKLQQSGLDGLGIYWCLIELLYESGGSLELDYERLAFNIRTQCDRIEQVINNYGLFEITSTKFSNRRVIETLNFRKSKSKKAQKSAKLRWNKGNAKAMRRQCEGNAIKERKGKEKKGKEIDISSEISKQISSLINEFSSINPTIDYGNTTQRKALKEMMDKFGYEKLLNTIKFAVSIHGRQFSPVITTPYQLKENMGKLLIYYQRENQPKKGMITSI